MVIAHEPAESFVVGQSGAPPGHQWVVDAAGAWTTRFSYLSVWCASAYATITAIDRGAGVVGCSPTHFVNISAHLDGELWFVSFLASRVKALSLAPSALAIRRRASVRSAASGLAVAAAFRNSRARS